MEFNADGSLKLTNVQKEKEMRISLAKSALPGEKGVLLSLEILDKTLPYNLIEGNFHEINTKDGSDCDATLSKKSDTHYDIVVSGAGHDKWVQKFSNQLSDYLDGAIEFTDA